MKQIRILFVINGLGTGGAERSLAEMLPMLVDSGILPSIVCLHSRREGVQSRVEAQGIPVRILKAGRLPSRVRELRGLIQAERPDLVHTSIFESDVSGRLAARGGPARVITSLVNTSYSPVRLSDPNLSRSRLQAARLVDGWTARHLTHHFHAITNAVKTAAVATLRIPPDRITVIERGRDPSRLGSPAPERRRRSRSQLGLSERDQVIINIGRQEYQKGQIFLLEAVKMLSETHPRLLLLVAGRQGHASRALETYCEQAGLEERVRLLGHRDDVPDLLAAADLFAFPSLYEGLGCAVIEAMALGLPVIATNLDAIREVVEEGANAALVAPGSATELAEAIREVFADPCLARSFSTRSRRIFLERFTLEASAQRMIELYRRVAHQDGTGGDLTPSAGRRRAR